MAAVNGMEFVRKFDKRNKMTSSVKFELIVVIHDKYDIIHQAKNNYKYVNPASKVHGANMGPQEPWYQGSLGWGVEVAM